MKCPEIYMRLYAVTDQKWAVGKTLAMQVEDAILGGITCVQLREKELSDENFIKEAIEVKKICHIYGIPFFINDNINVAIKCNADGIHVGQHDMNALDVRQKIGSKMILGVSVQTPQQAINAEENSADYLGVGAVFSTHSKPDADYVSHQTLQDICDSVSIPVVAIGGINKHNILELRGTGVDGVALISAIFSSKDIEAECKQLRNLSDKMVSL